MAELVLAPNEVIVTRAQAQLAKGFPQTVGDLYLTNWRLVLVPNQMLSIGAGKSWEVRLIDIASIGTKAPLQGGPFLGSAGNRLVITMKDGTQHILSMLGAIAPLEQAILAQMGQPTPAPTSFQAAGRATVIIPPTAQTVPSSPKEPLFAVLLSLVLLGGAGQIYLGQTKKGLIIMAVTFVTLFIGLGFAIWVLGIVDALLIARRINAGETVGEMQFF